MFGSIGLIRNTNGITLIETLVAIFMGSILVLGSFALLTNVRGTMTGSSEAIQVQQEARNIVENIAREIREASPEKTWLYSWSGTEGETADTIFFYTSRDEERRFVFDSDGKPEWQREIAYALDPYSNNLYRFQYYISSGEESSYQSEIVSRNVEKLTFNNVNDMLIISIRTFADTSNSSGNTARAYADFNTMIKLRN